ncbi:MAG TPA: phosphoribosyl-ATP diphosphatase, partial [Pyrinomonadaceae bacterium]
GDSRGANEVGRPAVESGAGRGELGATLAGLYGLIEERRRELPAGSYTTYLFREGLDKILKKVGEESAETIIAAKNADAARLVGEVADLVYHLLVLLVERGVTLDEVGAELARRGGKGGGE